MSRSRRVLAIGGKHCDYGRTGSVFSILISYRKFLGDKSSKQVASIVNDCEIFNEKNDIRLIIAGFTSTFDTFCLCRHNSISFSCMIYKSHVS